MIAVQNPKVCVGHTALALIAPISAECPDTKTCPPAHTKRSEFVFEGAKEDAAFANLFSYIGSDCIGYSSVREPQCV